MTTSYWRTGGARELTLEFPAPTVPLSINQAHSLHWAARRKRTNPWRDMAFTVMRITVRQHAGSHLAWELGRTPVTIGVALPFRTSARRDPHNYTGTNVKALVDGLVAGGLIPDDAPEWATILEPTLSIQRDKARPLMATVTIIPRSTT